MYYYNLFALLAFFYGVWAITGLFKKENIRVLETLVLLLVIFILSRTGAYLLYSLETGNWKKNWYDYFSMMKGGMSSLGGLYFAFTIFYIYTRFKNLSFLHLLDKTAPTILICFAIARFGCLFAGCCRGIEMPQEWVLPHFIPRQHHFPAPLLHTFLNMSIAVYLIKMPEPSHKGIKIGYLLLLYGMARFFVEYIRLNPVVSAGLTSVQLISISIILAGFYFITRPLIKNRKTAINSKVSSFF